MSGLLGQLNIQLTLDQARFQQNLGKAQNRAKQFSVRSSQYLNNIEKAAQNLNNFTRGTFWAGFAGGRIAQLKNYADGYTEIQNKLRLVESASINSARGLESVFDISLKTNQSIQATSGVYQRFAQNAEALKISQAQVASLTETVSKAVAMSGASAESAQAALMQFGQALGSGVFRGDEFNSVMEQTPGLAKAIADGLGVTTGELRNMAEEGKLTTDVLIPALERAKSSVDSQFGSRILTISAALENLSTATVKWVGETDNAIGVSRTAAEIINGFSHHLTVAATVMGTFGAAVGATKLNGFIAESRKQALVASEVAQAEVKRTAALRAEAQAEMSVIQLKITHARTEAELLAAKTLAEAQAKKLTIAINAEAAANKNLAIAKRNTSAAGRLLGGALGLVGGPIGALAVGLSLGAGYLLEWRQEAERAKETALAYSDNLEQVSKSLEKMNGVQLRAEQAKLEENIIARKQQIEELKKRYDNLTAAIKTYQAQSENNEGFSLVNYGEKIASAMREQAKVTADLEEKQRLLNDAMGVSETISSQLATTTENETNAVLSNLGFELLRTDKNVQTFNSSMLIVANNAANVQPPLAGMMSKLLNVGDAAREGADGLLIFNQAYRDALSGKSPQALNIDDKTQAFIDRTKLQNEINNAKSKKDWVALNTRRDLDSAGITVKNDGYMEAYNALDEKYSKQWDDRQNRTQRKSAKSGENARDSWLNFYDEIRKKNSSSLGEIELEQARMFQRLEEHNKKGVVSYQEYETAKTAIAERFARQRLELAGKYAPEKLLKANRDDELKSIQELYEKGQINQSEAAKASNRVQFDYAQQMSQSAVDPLAQFRAQFDPNQEIENQRTRDLALLEAMQSGNEQKLLSEEEYQRRKKEIQDKYDLERQKKESDYYAQSTQMMSSAFDTMAGVMANAAGQQSSAYKAMFAASKAFAIAESIINIQLALSEAAKLPYPANLVEYARVASQTASIVSNIQSVTMSFATGGYTGDGGKYTPAGIVHKGEYVITKEATARLGRGFLDHLNYGSVRRGFANGGGVGVPRLPTMAYQPKSSGDIAVKVINNGEPMDATVSQQSRNGQLEITVELVRQIAQAEAGTMLQKNMRPGGLLS
ncbi:MULTISPECIES: tape measure protein [Haemophilus]|jgi:putative tail component similar to cryptic prophage cp-933p (putative tail length tape measure protein)|uniref:tape measure protein n=1 Tax=Haemophilus TaxID=724 RepID=UPI0006691216|nr:MULTISPECIES: tape measure protein [Haemophilus]DAO90093.1 MAG TPA: Tail tape measure [Bacteriophage sp.]